MRPITTIHLHSPTLIAACAVACLVFSGVVTGQYDDRGDLEYEPDEGVHEEEWYDPSDWFEYDDRTVDVESDWQYEYYDDYSEAYDDYPRYEYDDFGRERDYEYHDQYSVDSVSEYDDRDEENGRNAYNDRNMESDEQLYDDRFVGNDDQYLDRYSAADVQAGRTATNQGRQSQSRQGRSDRPPRPRRDNDWFYTWNPDTQLWVPHYTDDTRYTDAFHVSRNISSGNRGAQPRPAVQGTIESTRRVQLSGERDRSTLVKIRMRDDRARIVNLGSRVELSNLNLQSGDDISVFGWQRSVDGHNVVMAEFLRVDGRSITARSDQRGQQARMRQMRNNRNTSRTDRDRATGYQSSQRNPNSRGAGGWSDRNQNQSASTSGSRRSDRSRSQTSRQTDMISGTVEDYRRMRISQRRESATFVKLRLDSGETSIVNLGPRVDLRDLNLQRDDRVTVRGRETTYNGKTMLLANAIVVEGNRTNIDRNSSDRRGRSDRDHMRYGNPSPRNNRGERQDVRNSPQRTTTIRGLVDSYRVMRRQGEQRSHTLVKLRLDDGSARIVDLGANFSQHDKIYALLDSNDFVMVMGHRDTFNGRSVLDANRMRIDDDRIGLTSANNRR